METIEEVWMILKADLLKLKMLLEKESPGVLTEQIVAVKALTGAMAKRLNG